MLATAFDPLAAARDLKAAGFESEQAEALAAQLRVAAGADHADLATKADVAALRTEMKADVAELRGDVAALRTETKADIAELKGDVAALRTETKADVAELKGDVAALRTETKADVAELKGDVAALRTETKAAIAGLRAELGTIRWAVGLMAAFTFAIGLRVFGLI